MTTRKNNKYAALMSASPRSYVSSLSSNSDNEMKRIINASYRNSKTQRLNNETKKILAKDRERKRKENEFNHLNNQDKYKMYTNLLKYTKSKGAAYLDSEQKKKNDDFLDFYTSSEYKKNPFLTKLNDLETHLFSLDITEEQAKNFSKNSQRAVRLLDNSFLK